MINLRALLFGLLLVALLPWGAWRSDAVIPQPQPHAVVTLGDGAALLRIAHRCRTAIMPGQSCGQEPVILPRLSALAVRGAIGVRPPLAILLGAALLPDMATPPPKAA